MGVAVIFPGQGTQHSGMGVPWRATPSWRVVEQAEEALGRPLAPLLLEASDSDLGRTLESQMSVFLLSLVAWDSLAGHLGHVVGFAGHSLGQLTALVASGALDLDSGVRLVAERAAATQAAADRRPGRMVALVGAELGVAEAACSATGGSWVANDNAPGQVVLGGTPEGVEEAAEQARALGVRRTVPLRVGGAFHTPLMAEARDALVPVLDSTRFGAPAAPVVSNVDGQAWSDPGAWADHLADHLVSTVRWRQCQITLAGLGADAVVEVGPGGVLAGLARRTLPDVPVRSVGVPSESLALTSLEVC